MDSQILYVHVLKSARLSACALKLLHKIQSTENFEKGTVVICQKNQTSLQLKVKPASATSILDHPFC